MNMNLLELMEKMDKPFKKYEYLPPEVPFNMYATTGEGERFTSIKQVEDAKKNEKKNN